MNISETYFEKFKEELTSKENFYSSLTSREISDKEYEHVFNVWKKFEMETMAYYNNLYLKSDVLSLADLFEKLKNNSLKNYGLCPGHYMRVQCLSWDVMLKTIKVKLELIPDLNMYIFFDKVTRGGISYIVNTCSKSSNEYLKSYPFVPDKIEINKEMLSEYQLKIYAMFLKAMLKN